MKAKGFMVCIFAVQGGVCFHCQQKIDGPHQTGRPKPENWTREHIVPKSMGGTDYRNIAIACYRCNGEKGDRAPTKEEIELCRANWDLAFELWARFNGRRQAQGILFDLQRFDERRKEELAAEQNREQAA